MSYIQGKIYVYIICILYIHMYIHYVYIYIYSKQPHTSLEPGKGFLIEVGMIYHFPPISSDDSARS